MLQTSKQKIIAGFILIGLAAIISLYIFYSIFDA